MKELWDIVVDMVGDSYLSISEGTKVLKHLDNLLGKNLISKRFPLNVDGLNEEETMVVKQIIEYLNERESNLKVHKDSGLKSFFPREMKLPQGNYHIVKSSKSNIAKVFPMDKDGKYAYVDWEDIEIALNTGAAELSGEVPEGDFGKINEGVQFPTIKNAKQYQKIVTQIFKSKPQGKVKGLIGDMDAAFNDGDMKEVNSIAKKIGRLL
jgi:hypothetical protein